MGPRNRKGSRNENADRGSRLINADEAESHQEGESNDSPASEPSAAPEDLGPDGADTQDEARRVAQEAVWQNARKLVKELADEAGGNYLAVRFLFEFAGLTALQEQQRETKPDFKAFMQNLLNRPKSEPAKQTSEANLNLSSSGGSQNGRS